MRFSAHRSVMPYITLSEHSILTANIRELIKWLLRSWIWKKFSLSKAKYSNWWVIDPVLSNCLTRVTNYMKKYYGPVQINQPGFLFQSLCLKLQFEFQNFVRVCNENLLVHKRCANMQLDTMFSCQPFCYLHWRACVKHFSNIRQNSAISLTELHV